MEYKQVKTINEFIDYVRLRTQVFILEQGFKPGWEPDENDKVAKHFIAVDEGKVVCSVRFREQDGTKIERMATAKDYRGKGVARELLEFVLSEAKKEEPERIWCIAQTQAQPFWEKCGFKTISKPYDIYGVEHVDMEFE